MVVLLLWFVATCDAWWLWNSEPTGHDRPDHEYLTDEEAGIQDLTPHISTPDFVSYNTGIPGHEIGDPSPYEKGQAKKKYVDQLMEEWGEVDHDDSGQHGFHEITDIINHHVSPQREHAYATADHWGDQNSLLSKDEYDHIFPHYYETKQLPGNQMTFEMIDTNKDNIVCITELTEATRQGAETEAKKWLALGDKNGDSHLSEEEFIEVHSNYWDKIEGGHPRMEL
jgi:hypothetical protein